MSALDLLTEMGALNTNNVEAQVLTNVLQLLGSEDETSVDCDVVIMEQIDTAWDVLDRNTAMLEMHLNTFEKAIGDGGVAKETLAALAPVINAQCGLVGEVFTHYSSEQLDKPGGRIEAAEYSAESIKETLKKDYDRTIAFFDRIITAFVDFMKKHVTKVGRFKKKADSLAAYAKDLKGTPGDAKVTASKELFVGTKLATAKDIEDAAKMLIKVTKGSKGIDDAVKALASAYSDVKVANDAEAVASVAAIDSAVNGIADAIQDAYEINKPAKSANVNKKLLPKEEEYAEILATETLPGNFVIVLGKPGDKSDRMPAISVLPTEDKVKSEEIPALGKSEIETMSSAVSSLADAIVELGNKFNSKVTEDVKKGAKAAKDSLSNGSDSIIKENASALTDRIKQMRQVAKLIREPATPVSTRLATLGMAAYNVAYRSAKAHKAEK